MTLNGTYKAIQNKDLCKIGQRLSTQSLGIFIEHISNCKICNAINLQKMENPIHGQTKTEYIMNIILTEPQAQKLMIIIDIYIEKNKQWMERNEIEELDIISNYIAKLINQIKTQ